MRRLLRAFERSFIACTYCKGPLLGDSFPLCELCYRSLIPSPKLCPRCASPSCLQDGEVPCKRPWITNDAIHSFSALYLLLEPGYSVLKQWKKTRGPVFNQRVLNPDRAPLGAWKNFAPDAIVPVPQRTERSWKMGGSPALAVAEFVSTLTGVPIIRALAPPLNASQYRQAELPMNMRMQTRIPFEPGESLAEKRRIILVDDFMTSGHTLRAAAKTLQNLGADEIHVFCLGLRLFHTQAHAQSEPTDLHHRVHRPVAVSHKTQSAVSIDRHGFTNGIAL